MGSCIVVLGVELSGSRLERGGCGGGMGLPLYYISGHHRCHKDCMVTHRGQRSELHFDLLFSGRRFEQCTRSEKPAQTR